MSAKYAWSSDKGKHSDIVRRMKETAVAKAALAAEGSMAMGVHRERRPPKQATASEDPWWLDCLSPEGIERYEQWCQGRHGCRRRR